MAAKKEFNAQEMEVIREKDRIFRSKLPPVAAEKNEAKPVAYFEIDRYVKGPFLGLFVVCQMITEDGAGHALKRPIRKVIADGVDMIVAISTIETAIRRRVFR